MTAKRGRVFLNRLKYAFLSPKCHLDGACDREILKNLVNPL